MATPIPNNEALFSLGEMLACTGASTGDQAVDPTMVVRGVSSDTRQLGPGQAFVALAGAQFDGHDHLASAAAAGASVALVERSVESKGRLLVLEVPSTLDALGALAGAHLDRWRRQAQPRQVIALTGSAGKTTTRTAVSALLSALVPPGQIHQTRGNLNNLIGVPMTLLGLGDEHRYAVLELGTSEPGEIPKLARMVKPDVGLITLIARAHAEGLGGIEAIAREKCALYDELSGALAIGNADDPLVLAGMRHSDARQRVSYGLSDQASYRIVDRQVLSQGRSAISLTRPDGSSLDAEIGLIGHAGALACAAAVATVETVCHQRVDGPTVTAALGAIDGAGRLQPQATPMGAVVIDDSYNANPASSASSIEAASEIAQKLGRRLILVLGEMRELGSESAQAHQEIGSLAADRGAALVIAVAGDARRLADQAAARGVEAVFVEDAVTGAQQTLAAVGANDVVLVKGSRSVGTERVVRALMAAVVADEGSSA
jgi:UDP-N-acetylmuramoyl-tripeptide--D-alanyl-D-alanine ligase